MGVGWEVVWEVEWEEKLLNTVSSHHNFQRLSVMLSHKGLEWEALEAWEGQEWEAQKWDLEVVQWVEVVQEAVPDLDVEVVQEAVQDLDLEVVLEAVQDLN